MNTVREVFILSTFYSFLWAFLFYYLSSIKVHIAFRILILIPILLFIWWIQAAMVFTMLPALFLIYKIKPKIHIAFVLINLALIGYLYYHNAINLYKFQKMCKNKEYYIEIVDNNYSIEDIRNQEYYATIARNIKLCDRSIEYCPKKTTVVHYHDVFLEKDDKIVAKTYNIFRPYDILGVKTSALSRQMTGEYCESEDRNMNVIDFYMQGAKNE